MGFYVKENIILFGSSGHAKVVIDIIEKQGFYNLVGLIDSFRDVGEKTLGYPVLGTEKVLPALIEQYDLKGILLAVGDNHGRATVAHMVHDLAPDLPLVSAVHPTAVIGRGVTIGKGTVVMAGAILNPCSSVGRHCIVNTKASLGHDAIMDDFSSIAPGSTIAGDCHIGTGAAISLGASIKQKLEIGEHSLVGAGSLVLQHVQSYSLVYGVPAIRVRSWTPGERYL